MSEHAGTPSPSFGWVWSKMATNQRGKRHLVMAPGHGNPMGSSLCGIGAWGGWVRDDIDERRCETCLWLEERQRRGGKK